MPWVKLDDKYHSNPKVLNAGLAGAGLNSLSLSYCGDHMTDGFIPSAWAAPHPKTVRDKLVKVGLWKKVRGGYQIPDFTQLNPTKAEIEAKRAAQRAGGRLGAAKRWGDEPRTTSANGKSTDRSTHRATHDESNSPDPTPKDKDLEGDKTTEPQTAAESREPQCPLTDCGLTFPTWHRVREHLANVHWIEGDDATTLLPEIGPAA